MPSPIAAASNGSPTSRIMRSRPRESFRFGGGAPSVVVAGASGTTFSEGSAIAFHAFRRRPVGNCLFEVFARAFELREHRARCIGVDAREHGLGKFLDLGLDVVEQRTRC